MEELDYIKLEIFSGPMDDSGNINGRLYYSRNFETADGCLNYLVQGEADGRWERTGGYIIGGPNQNVFLKVGGQQHTALVREAVFQVAD